MKKILNDLWQTKTENPAKGLYTHAYLLIRDDDNVLFYNTGIAEEIDKIAELGGVNYQLLSHQDELGDSLKVIKQRFDSKLGGPNEEREAFAKYLTPDILYGETESINDIKPIPTPGHTPGSTCFLVKSLEQKSYLFTGDTLYLSKDGIWKAGYIPGYSDKQALIESLKILKELKPDVVLCSGSDGSDGYQIMKPKQWPKIIENTLKTL